MDHQAGMDKTEILNTIAAHLESGNEQALIELLAELHETDIADFLRELEDHRSYILGLLDPEKASEVLAETGEDFRSEILHDLDDRQIRRIFHEMADDDAADILGELSDEGSERVLQVMRKEDQEEVKVLLEYDEESAGGIMTSEVVAIDEDLDVGKAMEIIREKGQEVEEFYMVFVTDADHVLKGTVSLRDLILADRGETISHIMEPDIIRVDSAMDQEEVARIMKRYNLVSIPVVDGVGRLIGRVTVDDILDIVEAEVTEDLLRMGGADIDEEIYGGTTEAVRFRLPWLFLNLLTAFVGASVVGYFAETIQAVIVLAVFMPVIAGLAGNAATQSLAVTLRRLTLGELSTWTKLKIIRKEFLTGASNGLLVGILVSIIAYTMGENSYLGIVVGLAMFLTVSLAGTIGAFIPITLKDLGFDPAVASTVFITAFTDLVGFFLLLGLGTLLLSYLI